MENQKTKCKPVTDQDYAEVFATYSAQTREHEQVLQLAEPVLKEFGERPIDALSIGTGAARNEDLFVNRLGLKLNFFHAIEPNSTFCVELEKKIKSWKIPQYKIDENNFDAK